MNNKIEKFKSMAITYLSADEIKSRLHVNFNKTTDMLGSLLITESQTGCDTAYQIRIRENSPQPATEIMLKEDSAVEGLNEVLKKLNLTRDKLFWIHPRAGGTLRRSVVDNLIANLEVPNPLIQIIVGPRQVGKTTSVEHLMREWEYQSIYASADSIVDEHGPWLENLWREALLKGEGTLLVIDEIQKIENWVEKIKELWDKTKKRGIRVVVLGSTSLSHFVSKSAKESLAGRFNSIYVPHWSFLETQEAFGVDYSHYSLFGGYPKAMELSNDKQKWSDYLGQSIINPIIDVDIYQQGNFKKIESLRRAFKVFSSESFHDVRYVQLLNEIQTTGNTDIIKKYLDGYYDSFLFSSLKLIDDKGNESLKTNHYFMANCPAIYSYGKNTFEDIANDNIRFKHSVAHELKRTAHLSLGVWQKSDDVKMDFYFKTFDDQVFGVFLDNENKKVSRTKSFDFFRKVFKKSRIVTLDPDKLKDFTKGPRAYLEIAGI